MSTSDEKRRNELRTLWVSDQVLRACSATSVACHIIPSDQSERTSNIYIAGITTANFMSTSYYASSINCDNSIHNNNNNYYRSFTVTSPKRSNSSEGTWQSVARQFTQKHRRSATDLNTSVCCFFEYRPILIYFNFIYRITNNWGSRFPVFFWYSYSFWRIITFRSMTWKFYDIW